ncbi:unnamed protein product [Orchesella dallaii]|uniref:Transmembrane protein n=1 Tax=Orchesella dallaii TaxID=48710 RepID=A0ABP1S209_9HEXA
MFFNLQELGQWLGVTAYEIWIWLTSLAVFTVLLSLKLDGNMDFSWWVVFSPLFIGDALNAYFVVTVFIRMYIAKRVRPASLRTLWSLLQLVLVFLFEYLLCWKLTDSTQFEYSEVMAPLFILSQFIMIRACQLH